MMRNIKMEAVFKSREKNGKNNCVDMRSKVKKKALIFHRPISKLENKGFIRKLTQITFQKYLGCEI